MQSTLKKLSKTVFDVFLAKKKLSRNYSIKTFDVLYSFNGFLTIPPPKTAINGGKPNNFAEHSEKAFKTVFDVFLAKTSSNNKKLWTIFRKQRFLTIQHRQTAALTADDHQKLFIISSQIVYPSFEISKNMFNVSLALKLWKLSLKMETAGLLINRQKRRVMSKILKPLNSYRCKLSKTVFNFFVSSKSREMWEFKNLAVEH